MDGGDAQHDVAALAAGVDVAVRFDDVTFGYGGPAVLHGLTFTAPARRMTAIVGPSGSGKSTFLRTLNRLETHDHGEIIVDVYLMVRYGYVIPETARKVQDSVSAAVSGMTGYNVHAVNVHVGGISFN